MLRRHWLLLGLFELVESAEQVDLLPLQARRDGLGPTLQEVQGLARLFYIGKVNVRLLPEAIKS